MTTAAAPGLDPVRYEIFAHRLWAIGEEGRIALQRVSASPIVVQGGECMSSFYTADGTMMLACSGHLRFASATSHAIKQMIEWYANSPGFHDGDQIFFNDPYVAGSHTYDQMVVMPIFHAGRLIAWTASSSHTADVGGSLSGEPTQIFHEGIRIQGLKIVDGGTFRQDVFRTLAEQCRDPEYVGLDLKSRIAANNVCARGFVELIDKFGVEFVLQAGDRLIADGDRAARAKLESIPDGTWRSRQFVTTRDADSGASHVIEIALETRKTDDRLVLSFAGSSDQVKNDFNSTLPSTLAHVHVALASFLFWDAPWSDGRFDSLTVDVPEGSILNCRYPAACNRAPWVGQFVEAAVADCVARMLFAAGSPGDVNAGWFGYWYTGGPGYFYSGRNREQVPTAHGLYDIHGGGLGAAPHRDGVDSGGHMNIPSGGISDVERTEMQYPFLYFSRRHIRDGGGFGAYRGGAGTERLLMVYGSSDLTTNYQPYGALPQGSAGLFGGHGAGTGGTRAIFACDGLEARLQRGEYPVDPGEISGSAGFGTLVVPSGSPRRLALPEYTVVSDFTQSGGGYGDPLERPPAAVAADVAAGITSRRVGEVVYGVILGPDGSADRAATDALRRQRRSERLAQARLPAPVAPPPADGAGRTTRIHEALALVETADGPWVQCLRCQALLAPGGDNYKVHVAEARRSLLELAGESVPGGEPFVGELREFYCPSCAVLLQVDVSYPVGDPSEPLWDIQLAPAADAASRSPGAVADVGRA